MAKRVIAGRSHTKGTSSELKRAGRIFSLGEDAVI